MSGKKARVLVLAVTVGLLGVGCSSDTSTDEATTAVSETTKATIELGTPAPESTTTTGATDGSTADDGTAPRGGECTVVVTGDREDTWTFDAGTNRVGIATDYWFSDEALQAAVEELGGSYDEFVAKGEPLVSFLSIWCSESDDPVEPGQGVDVRATNATRAADLAMGPGSYPIAGGGGVINEGPAGTMVADVMLIEDEIYETIADSGSLEISRWDMAGIEGSFSFAALEMFVEDPKELKVAVQFSLSCETPWHTC